MLRLKQSVPWQFKIATKLVLTHIPLDERRFRKVGVFHHGGMERPDYALGVFRRHFDRANFPQKAGNFVALELGPGHSLSSGLIARTLGASHTYLVDAAPVAWADVPCYRRMEAHLRQLGLQPPSLDQCRNTDDVAKACGTQYLTEGLASLRTIPSASADFVWSHGVLQVVRRAELLPTLKELRRIQRPGGVGSHCVCFADIVGGRLNDLRFSERLWESSLMARPGIYTNRVLYSELLGLFLQAGFEPDMVNVGHWDELPTPKRKMAQPFAALSDEELKVREIDVLLR